MSYCRFGEGDVYIFFSVDHLLECCGCILQEREWVDDESLSFFISFTLYPGKLCFCFRFIK